MGRLIPEGIKWLGVFLLFMAAGAFIHSRQNDPIVGSWIGIHGTPPSTGSNFGWVFNNNKISKRYINGKLYKEYTYKLSQTPNHCGVDMSDRLNHFPNNRILILTNTKTGKKTCSLVYKLTDKRLILSSYQAETASGVDTLKKVQQ